MSRKPLSIADTILIALVMLLGAEGVNYFILEKDLDEWKEVAWVHRN